MRRRPIHATFGSRIADEVLAGRDDAVFQVWPLQPADVGRAQGRNQVRVFAQGFFDAAPARVTGDVEDWGERVVRAD